MEPLTAFNFGHHIHFNIYQGTIVSPFMFLPSPALTKVSENAG